MVESPASIASKSAAAFLSASSISFCSRATSASSFFMVAVWRDWDSTAGTPAACFSLTAATTSSWVTCLTSCLTSTVTFCSGGFPTSTTLIFARSFWRACISWINLFIRALSSSVRESLPIISWICSWIWPSIAELPCDLVALTIFRTFSKKALYIWA